MNYIPPGMFKSTCKIDITWFPFDTQKCELKFGSWTYDGGTVDLRFKCDDPNLDTTEKILKDPKNCSEKGSGDISTYVESGEWNLEGLPGVRTSILYDCCPLPYIDLKFYLLIRRRKLYYVFNLIGPCSFLSSLALLSFIIPPDAGEKVSFGMPGVRTALLYDCCPFPFIDLKYWINIRRRTLYYGFNLIIPCVLISSMALLTFMLPPDAGEKISLGVTILLSLTMFLLLVADAMPQTSEALPLIEVVEIFSGKLSGMYFACTMIMCSLSVVFTVIVLNYHHRDAESHPIPNWVRQFICTYLASILCMRRMRRDTDSEPIRMRRRRTRGATGGGKLGTFRASASAGSGFGTEHHRELLADHHQQQGGPASMELRERSSKSLLANVLDLEDNFRASAAQAAASRAPPVYDEVQQQQPPCSVRSELAAIVHELRIVTQKISDDVADGEVSSEWKFAARVVDRLCLILFSCFTIISTCAILFSAP
uniref:Neuronal acetylcholine receptor subunit alpha-7 n=1 Tax=Macrostomum lignano TaxID=282301 RepID=A0A1I8HTP0_9PLAT